MDNHIMDWIYGRTQMAPALEKTLEAVEDALGFQLFVWQKTYIAHGRFRRYGETTAKILRELLNVSDPPLDYIKRPLNNLEKFYRDELKKVKERLDAAGIPTRPVFFSKQDKTYNEMMPTWPSGRHEHSRWLLDGTGRGTDEHGEGTDH